MTQFRHFLMCCAAALAIFGFSHVAPAYDSDENEASEHNGSHDEDSEHNEGSEHNGSHNEGSEHNGTTNSGSSTNGNSSSGSSSGNSGSDRDDSLGDSRDDLPRSSSVRNTPRSNSTARATNARSGAASQTFRLRDGGTETKATLRTIVGGRGSADLKESESNRSFEVELENTKLSLGTTLSVYVNGMSVGTMTVGRYGRKTKAMLKLESRLGHSVPKITAGSAITIRYSAATVAAGAF